MQDQKVNSKARAMTPSGLTQPETINDQCKRSSQPMRVKKFNFSWQKGL